MRVFTLFLMIGITIIGCAFTDISSRINPERPTESYNKVLIATAFNDLELEEAIQEKIKYSLGEHEVQSQYWINLFFPGSDYTAEEFVDKLKTDSIDAILVVYPEGAGIKSNFIPQITQSNTKGTAYTNPYGQTSYNSKTTTYSSGGYYVDKPWAKATAELYDAKTGTMIWMASINSRGNTFADFKLLAKSMGTKIVQKLAADGIIH